MSSWLTKMGTPQQLGVEMAHQVHGCLHSPYGWLWLKDSTAAHSGSRLRLRGLFWVYSIGKACECFLNFFFLHCWKNLLQHFEKLRRIWSLSYNSQKILKFWRSPLFGFWNFEEVLLQKSFWNFEKVLFLVLITLRRFWNRTNAIMVILIQTLGSIDPDPTKWGQVTLWRLMMKRILTKLKKKEQ